MDKNQELIEYCIFSKGQLSILFTSKEYTLEGALQRCLSLTKSFDGLELQARKNGVKFKLYPSEADIEKRRQERQRNKNSYAYQKKYQYHF